MEKVLSFWQGVFAYGLLTNCFDKLRRWFAPEIFTRQRSSQVLQDSCVITCVQFADISLCLELLIFLVIFMRRISGRPNGRQENTSGFQVTNFHYQHPLQQEKVACFDSSSLLHFEGFRCREASQCSKERNLLTQKVAFGLLPRLGLFLLSSNLQNNEVTPLPKVESLQLYLSGINTCQQDQCSIMLQPCTRNNDTLLSLLFLLYQDGFYANFFLFPRSKCANKKIIARNQNTLMNSQHPKLCTQQTGYS